MKPLVFACALAALAGSAGSALAWGDDGHKLVALIAYGQLTPKAKAAVDQMLAADTDPLTAPDFAARATWADKYRDAANRSLHYQQTHNWHFVDLEISGPNYAQACFGPPTVPPPASAGPENDCAVNKITQFERELADPATAAPERLMALKFILHFVGDIHQPLHASDDHDSGGNCEQVRLRAGEKPMALHHFWDDNVINGVVTGDVASRPADVDLARAAQTLAQDPAAKASTQWAPADVLKWAEESFGQAKTVAYNLPPHPQCTRPSEFTPLLLSADYQAAAVTAARTQVERAGGRLATILNVALR